MQYYFNQHYFKFLTTLQSKLINFNSAEKQLESNVLTWKFQVSNQLLKRKEFESSNSERISTKPTLRSKIITALKLRHELSNA